MNSAGRTRFADLARLFDEMVELGPEDRRARLEELSRAAPGMALELEALLQADAAPSGILDASGSRVAEEMIAAGETEAAEPPDLADRRLGAWRLLRRVGRGGMGEVWLAERCDGAFEQRVAVKILRAGLDTGEVAPRFLRERQLLARLQHPNIARLLDAGITTLGRPYFVMEYVEGLAITEYAKSKNLPLAERLRLIVACCGAVDVAHRQLVVHRDLKPSNIMVTAAGEVKLLDFGIAKSLASERLGDTSTRLSHRLLTPEYAAPEQVLGEPVTTATDVYGLGAVLFELLVGERPQRREITGSLQELVDAVESETVVRPSVALLGLQEPASAAALAERKALARRLRGDLDTILLKALAHDPERRYPSASALREDLQLFLTGRPVRARPDRVFYRSVRFVGRHRVALAAGSLLTLAIGGGIATLVSRSNQATLKAEGAERAAREVASELGAAELELARRLRAEGRLEEARGRARRAVELRRALDAEGSAEREAAERLLRELGGEAP